VRWIWSGALAIALAASACRPFDSESQGADGNGPRSASAPKVLTIGVQGDLPDFYGFGGIRSGGVSNVPPIALDSLAVQNERGEYQALLATEELSVARGTWRVNQDGTMDTVWKLRPGVKWHDGAPFTAEDMLFTLAVRKDPEAGARNFGRLDLVESASAPDPLTFAIRWSAPYVDANQALDLEPMARHVLEEPFLKDKSGFANSPFLTDQFVGLGPYRLVDWERGSQMVFVRFDDYYQGRPPLDRVIVRTLGDPNAVAANILSGAIDITMGSVGVDAAVDLQQRWTGTGNVVRFDARDRLQHVEIQFRPELARPRNGLTNLAVRQGLYQAIDRQALIDVASHGLSPIADSWVRPTSALRSSLEPLIPQFLYDPARAQARLAEAGWTRTADGMLVHSPSGERFETQLVTGNTLAGPVVANQWKEMGAQVSELVYTAAQSNDREYAASYSGGWVTTVPTPQLYSGKRLHGGAVRSAGTRWIGENRSGYSNPIVDALLDRSVATIEPSDRTGVLGQLVQAEIGDVAIMPLFWDIEPVVQLRGVKSQVTGDITTWNFFAFDKE
jgi:peptide/nickel transport system substrate-binding protein